MQQLASTPSRETFSVRPSRMAWAVVKGNILIPPELLHLASGCK